MKLHQIFIFVGVFLFTSAMLTSCSQAQEKTSDYSLPAGLQDCKVFDVPSSGFLGRTLQVVRCPNSSTTTTYKSGKTTYSSTVVEEEMAKANLKAGALKKLSDEEKQILGLKAEEQ